MLFKIAAAALRVTLKRMWACPKNDSANTSRGVTLPFLHHSRQTRVFLKALDGLRAAIQRAPASAHCAGSSMQANVRRGGVLRCGAVLAQFIERLNGLAKWGGAGPSTRRYALLQD